MLCTLDMLAELRFCRKTFPGVALEVLLQLACRGLDETLKKATECDRFVSLPDGRILLSQSRADPLEAVFDPRAKVLATRFTCG